jgi:hypothetical protein
VKSAVDPKSSNGTPVTNFGDSIVSPDPSVPGALQVTLIPCPTLSGSVNIVMMLEQGMYLVKCSQLIQRVLCIL